MKLTNLRMLINNNNTRLLGASTETLKVIIAEAPNTQFLINNRQFRSLPQKIKMFIDEAPNSIKKVKDEKKKVMLDSAYRLNDLYLKLVKLDQVELYQKRVESCQEELLSTQKRRKEAGYQLRNIMNNSLILQREIEKSKVDENRDKEKYIALMNKEVEMLRVERAMSRTFQERIEDESEAFTAYCTAIQASYEKQKYHACFMKGISYMFVIVGGIVGIFKYTYPEKNMQEMRKSLDEVSKAVHHQNNYSIIGSIFVGLKTGVTSSLSYLYGCIPSANSTYNTVSSKAKGGYNYCVTYFSRKK